MQTTLQGELKSKPTRVNSQEFALVGFFYAVFEAWNEHRQTETDKSMTTLSTETPLKLVPSLSQDDLLRAIEVAIPNLSQNVDCPAASTDVPLAVESQPSIKATTALPVAHDWGTRSHVQIFALISATTLGVYLCYLLAAPFFTPITFSLALAVICLPFHKRIEILTGNRNVAAAISVSTIGILVLLLVTIVGQRLVSEASSGAQIVGARVESGEWRHALESHPRLAPLADWMEQQNLPETVKTAVTWLSTSGVSIVRGSMIQLLSLLLTFYLLFFFLRDRDAGISALRSVLPLTPPEMDRLLTRVSDTVLATVYGTVTVAAVQGTLGGLMFWWLGLPAPLFWGVVMGLLAILPILGAFIVWIPAAIFLFLDGHWGQALILSLWGMIVVGTVDNLLRPILVGRRLQLHTVMAFFSVVGGIWVFGPAGFILGPVTLTVTSVLLEIWPRPVHQSTLSKTDQEAISSFENEGGPPPAVINNQGSNNTILINNIHPAVAILTAIVSMYM